MCIDMFMKAWEKLISGSLFKTNIVCHPICQAKKTVEMRRRGCDEHDLMYECGYPSQTMASAFERALEKPFLFSIGLSWNCFNPNVTPWGFDPTQPTTQCDRKNVIFSGTLHPSLSAMGVSY